MGAPGGFKLKIEKNERTSDINPIKFSKEFVSLHRKFFWIPFWIDLAPAPTPPPLCIIGISYFSLVTSIIIRGEGIMQCLEHLPPTNVARIQFPASTPYASQLSLLLVPILCSKSFSPGTPFFSPSTKTNTSKFQFNL